ncbi:MAG: hypothetical protein ABIE74_04395, partial [Pseudomonadota bacterium]
GFGVLVRLSCACSWRNSWERRMREICTSGAMRGRAPHQQRPLSTLHNKNQIHNEENMTTKITEVTLKNNQFIFDGRHLPDYEINEPLRMPDDKIVIIVPSALTTQTLDVIEQTFNNYDISKLFLVFQKSGKFDCETFKGLEPKYCVYVGLINEKGDFLSSKLSLVDDKLSFREYKKLPIQYKKIIYNNFVNDIVHPTCRDFSGDLYSYFFNNHLKSLDEIVDEFPCVIAYIDDNPVAYLGWTITDAIPGYPSFYSTHWLQKSLNRDTRANIHTHYFNHIKRINTAKSFCIFAHIKNERSIQLFIKNNYIPFGLNVSRAP